MKTNEKQMNLTMLCDFYELTMGNGYYASGMQDQHHAISTFSSGTVPDGGGFAIAAGLEQVIDYIQRAALLTRTTSPICAGGSCSARASCDYLRNFKFTGDIWAVPEGTPIFPNEPIMTVRAPAIEAQLIETYPAADAQPPEPDCHQGQPRRPRGAGPHRAGIRLPPGAGRATPPCSARAPPTSAAATARPAR